MWKGRYNTHSAVSSFGFETSRFFGACVKPICLTQNRHFCGGNVRNASRLATGTLSVDKSCDTQTPAGKNKRNVEKSMAFFHVYFAVEVPLGRIRAFVSLSRSSYLSFCPLLFSSCYRRL